MDNSNPGTSCISDDHNNSYDVTLNDVMDYLDKIHSVCTAMQEKIDSLSNENKLLREEITKINKQLPNRTYCSTGDVVNHINESTIHPSPSTYAQVLGSKSAIVIKPVNSKQSNSKTKLDIEEKIDPVDLNMYHRLSRLRMRAY